ncbi:hypothetical protein [Nannocystis pusilla]|uniref:hypothetical protein n=1 Tax=Nannocystis pusilla TaxID=889268 RepID=UPI003B7BC1E0
MRALNTSLTQSLDATAESVAIARQLPEEALQILALALAQDDMDLGEFLKSERSRPFVQALQRVSIITSQNANRLLAGGLLSDKGRELLVPALYASIVPDADLLDAASTELRNALARSAPYWLAASAYGGPGTSAVRWSRQSATTSPIEARAFRASGRGAGS